MPTDWDSLMSNLQYLRLVNHLSFTSSPSRDISAAISQLSYLLAIHRYFPARNSRRDISRPARPRRPTTCQPQHKLQQDKRAHLAVVAHQGRRSGAPRHGRAVPGLLRASVHSQGRLDDLGPKDWCQVAQPGEPLVQRGRYLVPGVCRATGQVQHHDKGSQD